MKSYLGETVLDIRRAQYQDHTPQDWALLWIEMYGGIDGTHHKDWVLDQVARILKGTKVIVKFAKWESGQQEHRFSLEEPTPEYHEWVKQMCAGEDGEDTYSYSTGIAP